MKLIGTEKEEEMSFSYLLSGSVIVPVPFFRNDVVSGLNAPGAVPIVAPGALGLWLLPSGWYYPLRLPMPGLEVVFRQNVVPVGGMSWGCLDLCIFCLGGSYFSLGIRL